MNVCPTIRLVANDDRLSLATIRAQPGGLPGERAVVGATHSSWFSFRATFLSAARNIPAPHGRYAIIPAH